MDKEPFIQAIEANAGLADDAQVDAFVAAVDGLADAPLEPSDVSRLVLALQSDEDQDEVRWAVVHLVEDLPPEKDAYLLGVLRAMEAEPMNPFVQLLLGRLSNSPKKWPGAKVVLDGVRDSGRRAAWIAGIRTMAARSVHWPDKLAALARMLAG